MSQKEYEEQLQQIERNKNTVTLYVEGLWNNLQYDLIDKVLAPAVLAHASDRTIEHGNQRFHQVIPYLRSAVPDLHLKIEHMLAENDSVALRLRVTGTHLGEFAGIAPTGNKVDFAEWFFMRLSQEKIVEYWYMRDQESLMRQLTSD